MSKSLYEWQLRQSEPANIDFLTEIVDAGYSKAFAEILWKRGIKTKIEFDQMLQASADDLYDPFLMHDMDKAVERIQEAILSGERILIYGDYDADGITSTSIMLEALEMLGADVQSVLPNRFIHGYGPNKNLFAEKIDEGIQLIITVDNGVAGHEAIDYANSRQVDVIITDHHELPPTLPKAYCVVHPRHPEGKYPFGELAGAGVAFKLATALLEEPPVELLDLACIGTVADLVSMTGENRKIVQLGLEVIKQNQRIGLQQLLKVSGLDSQKIDETSIGFGLGPRLNAIGRLGDPNPAIELMTTFDEENAEHLAKRLDQINQERKTIVQTITDEAMAMVNPEHEIHLIAGNGWNPGVLGIVAGNILKQTGRPTIVLAIDDTGSAKGSGRSTEALDLFAMLSTMRDLFTHFGGHSAAVGLTLPAGKIESLQAEMNQYVRENQINLDKGSIIVIDEKLKISEATLTLITELKKLAPFGTDNPVPHFLFEGVFLNNLKMIGAEQQHVKFSLTKDGQQLDAIGFNFGGKIEEMQQDDTRFVGDLEINEWNGQKKVQLKLLDFASEGLQVIDRRAKHTWTQPLETGKTMYVAFQEKSKQIVAENLREQVVVFDGQTAVNTAGYQQLVVLDCPSNVEELRRILHEGAFDRVYLFLYSADEAYLNGMPKREQFKQLYQFFYKQQRVDIRYKLKVVSNYLKIPEKLLIFMIHVFSELNFVTIDDGVLQMVAAPQQRSFEESQLYKRRVQQIKSEEFLLLSDIQTIRNWLKNESSTVG
ncbi:single-stranded-DNA-specific exonuclease RecJ [Enterococcus florum]|uniref:Single-stranded-DNA-specific exonuclease RecJ n=1 Tax=Enterococcus florum TaxID=2480627 RepID=A0A4P5PBI4_9ENTE|nr:single-stranded-DNA-specific exonuclease RecJ [Enterococcus florum]GCF93651.1 single-stranded-DNA-specific exonuclease RecJ [Enterococcus florum]